jgi:Domain of Unknown Function (DUF928)
MKYFEHIAHGLFVLLLISFPLSAIGEEIKEPKKQPASKDEPHPKKTSDPKAEDIVFRPPLPGAPDRRVGGGTRAPGEPSLFVSVLTPCTTGLTTQEQPDLYWYLSELTSYPLDLTIIEDEAMRPLLVAQITPPFQPGIQRVRLRDYNVHLKSGVEYGWSVAVVPDTERRSKDIRAAGAIERVERTPELLARLKQADKRRDPLVYAEFGIWYDAVSTVSEMIDAFPTDPLPGKQRASLLEQVRLSEVAGQVVDQGCGPVSDSR